MATIVIIVSLLVALRDRRIEENAHSWSAFSQLRSNTANLPSDVVDSFASRQAITSWTLGGRLLYDTSNTTEVVVHIARLLCG